MRWSQLICLTTLLLGVAVGEVLAWSEDQWTGIIARSPVVTKPKKSKTSKVTASSLKSSNYRKEAIEKGNVYDADKKQVVQSKEELDKADLENQHAGNVSLEYYCEAFR
jgi:hypothetical protein